MSAPTFVVGTAGHVDHGKSSLVRALTGTDPDRLAEEQRRQMTIDLGFAELISPAGNRIHLVDVPGHERFVRNMLAGAGGIDAAILVIAADDGPMPQTEEHLAILDLLDIRHGVVALSKVDLVDSEWRDFITESVRSLLDGSTFGMAEIVPVSSTTGQGLPQLLTALDRALEGVDRRGAGLHPRLPIDRVFSMPGFGTVVTGTLSGGQFHVGDRIVVLPEKKTSRIRGLQTFGESVQLARPGARVAINLTGLETSELARGDVIALPGGSEAAMRLDANFNLLPSSSRPLQHNDEVIVFTGSSETPARVALLDAETLEPGESCWVQLRLSRPVAVQPRDRYILRRPSPPETIGGGMIVELDPPRHKRFQPAVVARLEQLDHENPTDRALASLGSRFMTESEMQSAWPDEVIAELMRDEQVVMMGRIDERIVATAPTARVFLTRLSEQVDRYHAEHPLEPGMPRELLRQSLGLDRGTLDALLMESNRVESAHASVRRSGREIEFSPDQRRQIDAYLQAVASSGFQPPTPAEAGLPPELAQALTANGQLVAVGDGIVFPPGRIEEAQVRLLEALAGGGSISLAEYRDLLGTTRKYTQALLEYFDRQRVTRRVGDRRVAIGLVSQREGDATQ